MDAARLESNLAAVRRRVDEACVAAGRATDDVTLVAVTKYAEFEWVRGLYDLGVRDFGESRPQQLAERVALLPPVRWHLIGTLQRNKVRQTLEAIGPAGLVHSVDSRRLLDRVAGIAEELGQPTRVLLQVNVTGEESKHGFTPESVAEALAVGAAPVEVCGLMTMAARDGDAAAAFERLGELRDRIAAPGRPLSELSMGMSGDLEAGIAAGATLVRVGSALFEGMG